MTQNLEAIIIKSKLCDAACEAWNQNPTHANWLAYNDIEAELHDMIDALTPAEWTIYEKIEEERVC